jgi:hypothetical protein
VAEISNRFKLAAIDLDGTLLEPDRAISDANARAVRRFLQITFWRLSIVAVVASVLIQPLHAQVLIRVEQADFGKAQDGSEAKLITLRNARGMVTTTITFWVKTKS